MTTWFLKTNEEMTGLNQLQVVEQVVVLVERKIHLAKIHFTIGTKWRNFWFPNTKTISSWTKTRRLPWTGLPMSCLALDPSVKNLNDLRDDFAALANLHGLANLNPHALKVGDVAASHALDDGSSKLNRLKKGYRAELA